MLVTLAAHTQALDWTTFGPAIAQAFAALVVMGLTIFLVIYTATLARQARRSSDAAIKAATVSSEALQLDWRPILTLHFAEHVAVIKNVGRGPALNVLAVLYEWPQGGQLHVQRAWIPALAAADHEIGQLEEVKANAFYEAPTTYSAKQQGMYQRVVIFCQDQAGTNYRFSPPAPEPEIDPGDPLGNWAQGYNKELVQHRVEESRRWWAKQAELRQLAREEDRNENQR